MKMSSPSPTLMSLAAAAFVLTANFSPAAQAGPYGGSRGGDGFSGRYEKYLEEEAKREKAKAAKAQRAVRTNQQAGDVPATGSGVVTDLGKTSGATERVILERPDQRHRGR